MNFYYLNWSVGRQQHSDVSINLSGCDGEIYWYIEDRNKGHEQAK
jgi:hypothetical protein